MKVIIIEDELLAQAKLEAMLLSLDNQIEVVAKIASVKDSLRWLSTHPSPDLAFVDIQLSDDHSFEIFRKRQVTFPVIFTTAYDRYILESFEFNSIDYLLKPISEEKLARSLRKVKEFEQHFLQTKLSNIIQYPGPTEKSRIVAKKGAEFVSLSLDEVAYFYSEHKIVFARDFTGRRLLVDKTLGDIASILDRHRFFRINRKFIAQQRAIDRFKPDNGKIRVYLQPEMQEEIYVSKENASAFRVWAGG